MKRSEDEKLSRLKAHVQEIADVKAQADKAYALALVKAAQARDEAYLSVGQKEMGILKEFQRTAYNVLRAQNRGWTRTYKDPVTREARVGVQLPDEFLLYPVGVEMIDHYLDRGDDTTSHRHATWEDIFNFRAGRPLALRESKYPNDYPLGRS